MKNIVTIALIVIFIITVNFISAQVPASVGPGPDQTFQPWSSPSFYSGSRAWIYTGSTAFQLNKSSLANTNLTAVGTPINIGYPGAATWRNSNNKLWIVDQNSPYTLYTVDTTSGEKTAVVNCTGVPYSNLTGITWNHAGTILYGISTNLSASQIFTINTSTGVCTPIGTASTVCSGAVSISCSSSGSLYAICITTDAIYKVNPTTGVFSLIGIFSFNLNFGQDAQFDPGDDQLYWAACDVSGASSLMTIDTVNASTVTIGGYGSRAATIGIFTKIVGIDHDKPFVNVNVYPNPANQIVNISAENIETIKVLNITGQVIENMMVNKNNAQINIANYPAGIYIMQVKTDKGVFVKEFMVNN